MAVVVPDGGARVVSFGPFGPAPLAPLSEPRTIFDATGGLRDDVLVQLPPSATDRIAKFTHLYPAGMYNRSYAACTFDAVRGAGSYLAYEAPDVVPNPARFERVVMLRATAYLLIVGARFQP